jgi:xanthine/CO dehydrogenase XdhC/CoxF family maturation factor
VKELRQILEALDALAAEGRRGVLATIVEVTGSTYRRPGARMLIDGDGNATGLLSGGCLEGDLAERARAVLEDGRPRTVRYDMSTQEDLVWGLGLGCAGTVRVLLERVEGPADPFPAFLAGCAEARRCGAIATVFGAGEDDSILGRHLWADADGSIHGSLGDASLGEAVTPDLREALAAARHDRPRWSDRRYDVEGRVSEVLLESLVPPPRVVLFGGGADAVPLTRMANGLGWHVTVVDHRPAFAVRDRFPQADAVVLAAPGDLEARLDLGTHSVAVVMTHKYLHDVELLRVLLRIPLRYLGLLGPKARAERLLSELAEQGVQPVEGLDGRIHGPVGLDIGAETPEEIALSAVAEIQAVLTGRRGGFLSERDGPLHDRER